MKSGAGEIDSGAMSEPVDDVWMANAIERDGFVLKVCDQRVFELGVGRVLQERC